MNITIFFLIAVIGILIIYILVREQIVKAELEEEHNKFNKANDAAVQHTKNLEKIIKGKSDLLDKISDLITEEEAKDLKDKNSYSLIRKIKEVITSDQTK